jgi:hypothetical protein
MTDEDLANINSGKEKLNLVYKGTCSQTRGHLLAITGEEEYVKNDSHWPLCFSLHINYVETEA